MKSKLFLLLFLAIIIIPNFLFSQFIQQGSKLAGTGIIGSPEQGFSVAISSDGNTAIIGGPFDNGNKGAAWIFTRSSGVWSQQGSKLVGTGSVGNGYFGTSVAISSDGNTALVGCPYDSGTKGAAFAFTRSSGVWTQQGAKLLCTDFVGAPYQGSSVSISSDGNTALVGGYYDNAGKRSSLGIYTKRWGLDTARFKACWHRCRWKCRARFQGCSIFRW